MTPADEELGPAYWEARYQGGEGAGRLAASPSLLAEASSLAPGRALDAGCGVGADALWLAARGWQVTAVDVSATALDRGREAAASAGAAFADRLDWVHADLLTWEPAGRFDLVSSHYVHVPGPQEVLFHRLASWVSPGGSLLVVGHAGGHGQHGHPGHDGHSRPRGAQISTEQVVSVLPAEQWDVLAAEPRTHLLPRPGGGDPGVLHDVVVHARRRAG